MTQATQSTAAKPSRLKCAHTGCTTKSTSNSKYCTKHSTFNSRRAAGTQKRAAKFPYPTTAAIFAWFDAECARAETLAILPRTLPELEQIHSLHSRLIRANIASGNNGKYAMCHIHPVRGGYTTGTLSADNLFIGPSEYNREAKHFMPSHMGQYISITEKLAHSYEKTLPKAGRIEAIVQYIGLEKVQAWVKACKIKESAWSQLHTQLEAILSNGGAAARAKYGHLLTEYGISTKQLRAAIEALTGKASYKPSFANIPYDRMLMQELVRLSAYYPHLSDLGAHLAKCIHTFPDKTVVTMCRLNDCHTRTLFNVAQGFDTDDIRGDITALYSAATPREKIPDDVESASDWIEQQEENSLIQARLEWEAGRAKVRAENRAKAKAEQEAQDARVAAGGARYMFAPLQEATPF